MEVERERLLAEAQDVRQCVKASTVDARVVESEEADRETQCLFKVVSFENGRAIPGLRKCVAENITVSEHAHAMYSYRN
jgi:hypothetical protein